ncbi:MAG: phosphatidate cytidylyltransferase [Rikenellaceae bacterium]
MKLRESQTKVAVRITYGVLYAIAGIAIILLSPYGFGVLLFAVATGGTMEFYRIAKIREYKPHSALGVVINLLLLGLNYSYIFFNGAYFGLLASLLLLTIPATFVSELFAGSKNPIANIGSTLLPVLYIGLPLSLICHVAMYIGGGEWSGALMVAYLVITWANDSFAYLVGISIGRHVMFPRISPKKSWEGLVGGILGAFLFGLGIAWLSGSSYLVWGGVAILAAMAGVLGDLVESMFKRSVDIKDSGDLIPGHGGWLDRFDAFLISTPVVFVYLYILNHFGLI